MLVKGLRGGGGGDARVGKGRKVRIGKKGEVREATRGLREDTDGVK